MSKAQKTLKEFKRDMKELGYKVSITTNSSFKTAKIFHDGRVINMGNILTPEHLQEHKDFYSYKNNNSVRDGDWVVTY
jgi:hypothetical protein